MTSLTPPRALHLDKAEFPHTAKQDAPAASSSQLPSAGPFQLPRTNTLVSSLLSHAPRLHINSISNTLRRYHAQVTLHYCQQFSKLLCLGPAFLKLSPRGLIPPGPRALPIPVGSRAFTYAQIPSIVPHTHIHAHLFSTIVPLAHFFPVTQVSTAPGHTKHAPVSGPSYWVVLSPDHYFSRHLQGSLDLLQACAPTSAFSTRMSLAKLPQFTAKSHPLVVCGFLFLTAGAQGPSWLPTLFPCFEVCLYLCF